jgi:hypothetical protein
MTFSGLALHGFKSLMVFAEVVLVRISTACAAGVALAIAGALAAAILETIGCAAPNWFFFGMGILGLIFLQTGALTLMALMLTGIVRCRPVTTAIAYGDLVDEVVGTSKQPIPS